MFSFQLISFLVSFIWNSQKWPVSQNIWCLIKTKLKNITQTIFQGGSPWATLIHNSVVCLRVHYCVLLLPEVMIFWFFAIISFTFSYAEVFSFHYLITFLVSFIWNSQKCPISQNIWHLIKTQLKNITQTIFQGGSPWATLIHNSVVCLGVHYCVLLLPVVIFFLQSFPLPFPLLKLFSFMVFLWYCYWISMEFLWDFHDVSMIFLEDFYGFLWGFYGILMGFPLDSYGISMVFLLDSYGISIGFLLDFQGISMMFLWYFYGIIIGILMGFLCGSYAIPCYF